MKETEESATIEPNIISEDELVYISIGNLINTLMKRNKTESLEISLHLLKNFALKILSVALYSHLSSYQTRPKTYSASM